MRAEIARLDAMALEQLATEVMIAGFGPDGPGAPGLPGTVEDVTTTDFSRVGVNDIARRFSPVLPGRGVSNDLVRTLMNLVAEGLQVLENAALVRVSWQGGQAHYVATAAGAARCRRTRLRRRSARRRSAVNRARRAADAHA
jgi:hypothetical protein